MPILNKAMKLSHLLVGVAIGLIGMSATEAQIVITGPVSTQHLLINETIDIQSTGNIIGPSWGILGDGNNTATIAGGGIVSGGVAAIEFDGGGTIDNTGAIQGGPAGVGIEAFNNSVTITNREGALIDGGVRGIRFWAGGTLTNSGLIHSDDIAILSTISSSQITVTNTATGVIEGASAGLFCNSSLILDNAGVIRNTLGNFPGNAVIGSDASSILNRATGIIEATYSACEIAGTGSIDNAGIIRWVDSPGATAGYGASIDQGASANVASVTNRATGLIYGRDAGVYLGQAGQVANYGTIEATIGPAVYCEVGTYDNILTTYGGTITGGSGGIAVSMSGGNDHVTINGLSNITGTIDGGADTDTILFNFTGAGYLAAKQLKAAWGVGSDTDIAATDFTFTVLGHTYSFTSFEDARYIIEVQNLVFTPFALTPNQFAIAQAIDNNPSPSSDMLDVMAALGTLSGSQIPAGLNELSPQTGAQVMSNIAFTEATHRTALLERHFDRLELVGDGLDVADMNFSAGDVDSRIASLQTQLAGVEAARSHTATDARQPGSPEGSSLHAAKQASPRDSWGFFASGQGTFAQGDGNADIADFDFNTAALLLGADYHLTPTLAVGLLFSYGHTEANLDPIGSELSADTFGFGGYAAWQYEGWHADAHALAGWNNYDQSRRIVLPGLDRTANSSPDGQQVTAAVNGGYNWKKGGWSFGPLAGVQYVHLNIDGYTETGAGALDLAVNRQQTDSLRSSLGGRVSYDIKLSNGMVLTPEVRLSWQHEFLDDSRGVVATFSDPSAGAFSVRTDDPSRDWALLGLSLTGSLSERTSVFADYELQAGQSNFIAQSIALGVKLGF